MGRNIKMYNGSYICQTSNFFDVVSTGYTVPTGKIARIGFNVAAIGGRNSNNADNSPIAGFYAGTTSSASTSNRFLMAYSPGVQPSSSASECTIELTYNPEEGHKWSVSQQSRDKTPHCYIGDMCRERYTTRAGYDWMQNNFANGNDPSNSSQWGTLHWKDDYATTFYNQIHHFAPYCSYANAASYTTDRHAIVGPAHATAGETIYLFDYAGYGYNSFYQRAFAKCQWNLFIVEEDA